MKYWHRWNLSRLLCYLLPCRGMALPKGEFSFFEFVFFFKMFLHRSGSLLSSQSKVKFTLLWLKIRHLCTGFAMLPLCLYNQVQNLNSCYLDIDFLLSWRRFKDFFFLFSNWSHVIFSFELICHYDYLDFSVTKAFLCILKGLVPWGVFAWLYLICM